MGNIAQYQFNHKKVSGKFELNLGLVVNYKSMYLWNIVVCIVCIMCAQWDDCIMCMNYESHGDDYPAI